MNNGRSGLHLLRDHLWLLKWLKILARLHRYILSRHDRRHQWHVVRKVDHREDRLSSAFSVSLRDCVYNCFVLANGTLNSVLCRGFRGDPVTWNFELRRPEGIVGFGIGSTGDG